MQVYRIIKKEVVIDCEFAGSFGLSPQTISVELSIRLHSNV